jgi:hypothetical protein
VSRLRLAVFPFLLVLPAACARGPLPAEDVAAKVEEALQERSGVRPEIFCPEDLADEVGARTTCTMTAGDDPTEYDVLVTVTSIEDERVHIDIDVDDQPR